MAHISRHDGVFLMFQILTQAIYFFHPLVWLLNRRLKEYREMACDDASAGFRPASRIEYSRCLVEIAESVMQNPVGCESASTLLDHKHELLNRVTYQIKGAIMMSKRKTGLVVAALALIALPLTWYYSDATPAASSDGSPADAASSNAAQGGKTASHLSIIKVSIGGKSELAINDTKTSYDGFRKNMEKTVAGKEDKVVIAMACDDGVSMGTVFNIHAQLREMGLMKMSYVTSDGKDLTLVLPPLDYKDKLSEVPEKHVSTLAVKGGDVVVLQGKKLETAKLGDEIKKMLARDDKMILSVEISEKATYGDFMNVLAVAKSADCQRILINDPTG
jgi:biopolymer transport protein ExbD